MRIPSTRPDLVQLASSTKKGDSAGVLPLDEGVDERNAFSELIQSMGVEGISAPSETTEPTQQKTLDTVDSQPTDSAQVVYDIQLFQQLTQLARACPESGGEATDALAEEGGQAPFEHVALDTPTITSDLAQLEKGKVAQFTSEALTLFDNRIVQKPVLAEANPSTESKEGSLELDSPFNQPFTSGIPLSKPIPLPESSALDHLIAENKTNGNRDFAETFRQLGDMIKNQLNQTQESAPEISLQNTASPWDAGTAAPLQRPAYELQVELLPPSKNAIDGEIYFANMKIHPPELGAVMAKLKINKNSAELIILTSNHQVKQIVEANLSTLRENLQQADINLTTLQIHVQSEGGAHDQDNLDRRSAEAFMGQDDTVLVNQPIPSTKPAKKRINSLIDTYA